MASSMVSKVPISGPRVAVTSGAKRIASEDDTVDGDGVFARYGGTVRCIDSNEVPELTDDDEDEAVEGDGTDGAGDVANFAGDGGVCAGAFLGVSFGVSFNVSFGVSLGVSFCLVVRPLGSVSSLGV